MSVWGSETIFCIYFFGPPLLSMGVPIGTQEGLGVGWFGFLRLQ